MSDILRIVEDRMPEWVAFRRDLHRHPELGFLEYRTIARIADRLGRLGYTLRFGDDVMRRDAMVGAPTRDAIAAAQARAVEDGAAPDVVARMPDGMTGMVAELRRGEGPVVAMRFDVDALPVVEQSSDDHVPFRLGFASAETGVMHACGHDGHATIGLGVAEVAASPDSEWSGTLRLIFQPAEEGGRGARPMAEAGVVDDADVFLALHLGCDLPSRQVACAATEMMFSAKWDLTFSGLAAHAAGNPENGRNALLAAAQAVIGLYALPRHGQFATHVNVGRLVSGAARNVIPDRAVLQIELRGSQAAALEHMERRARDLLQGLAQAHQCELSIEELGRTIGGRNTVRMSERIGEVARSLGGLDKVIGEWPLGGGDDAAYFMQRVQERGGEAAYLILGSDLTAGHHASNFDFDERDIGTGVRLMVALLQRLSQDPDPRSPATPHTIGESAE